MTAISLDSDDCELRNKSTGETFPYWSEYTFNSDFTTPTDQWSFRVGDERIVKDLRPKLRPGTVVTLAINDRAQCTGPIDGSNTDASRGEGTTLTVGGRDALSYLTDSGLAPLPVNMFSPGQTLNDIYRTVIPQFGFSVWSPTDLANRNVITGFNPAFVKRRLWPAAGNTPIANNATGGSVGSGTSTALPLYDEYDPTRPDWFKTQLANQVKPHPGEMAFDFLARVSKRLALWLWCNALGDTVIVDQPDYESAAKYEIKRKAGQANYIKATWTPLGQKQPAVIFATGLGAGGINQRSTMKVAMVNEMVGCDASGNILPAVADMLKLYKGIRVLPIRKKLLTYVPDFATIQPRPIYLHDDDSKTPGQLEGFVRREMAERQATAFTLRATVERHTQNGVPWNVNEIVDVDDDVLGIHERMWIKERTFRKSRAGTFTDLVMIRPYTLQFGP